MSTTVLFGLIFFALIMILIGMFWLLPRVRPAKNDVLRIHQKNKKMKFFYYEQFPSKEIEFKLKEADGTLLTHKVEYEPGDIYENELFPWYKFKPVTYRQLNVYEGLPVASGDSERFRILSHRTAESYDELMRIHATNRTEKIRQQLIYVPTFPIAMFLMASVMMLVVGVVIGIAVEPHLTALGGP